MMKLRNMVSAAWHFMEPLSVNATDLEDALRMTAAADPRLWGSNPGWPELARFIANETDFDEMLNHFDPVRGNVLPEMLGAFWNPKVISGEWDLAFMGVHKTVFGVTADRLPVSDAVLPYLVEYDSGVYAVRVAARKFPLPVEVMEHIFDTGKVSAVSQLAKRIDLPISLMEKIADGDNWIPAVPLARRSDLPEHLVRKLALDSQSHVRSAVAARPEAPEDVFEVLASDVEFKVRAALIQNRHVPDYLHTLAALGN